jgi:hypothetical protein
MVRVEGYRFGRIVIDGEEQTHDVIILPGWVLPNWWREEGHALVLDDLGEVLDDLPERLIVGTGASGQMRPDPGTLEALRRRGSMSWWLAPTRRSDCSRTRTRTRTRPRRPQPFTYLLAMARGGPSGGGAAP